jgi:SAM-dependent methyltransferase
MRRQLLQMVACPSCGGELSCHATAEAGGEVQEGRLECRCGLNFQIAAGIPRFVPNANYASSFGLQWNRFRKEQLDSANQTSNSRQRFESETTWTADWMAGKWILDGGCGSGRFLEIAAEGGAQVVGVDISDAVDAAHDNLRRFPNAHLVQASIDHLPFRPETFDGVYCLGVLQHTPDPMRALEALTKSLKPGGRLAITAYERKPWTLLAGKYLLRPLTRRLPPRLLLALIRLFMPLLFPLTEILFRLPLVKRGFMFLIPVSNYVENPRLSLGQRYQWAVLDTFDALSPRFDRPLTEQEVQGVLGPAGMTQVRRGRGMGLNVIGEKQTQQRKQETLAALET